MLAQNAAKTPGEKRVGEALSRFFTPKEQKSYTNLVNACHDWEQILTGEKKPKKKPGSITDLNSSTPMDLEDKSMVEFMISRYLKKIGATGRGATELKTDMEIFKKSKNPLDVEKLVKSIIQVLKDTTTEKDDYHKEVKKIFELRKKEEVNILEQESKTYPARYLELMNFMRPKFKGEWWKDTDEYPGHQLFDDVNKALGKEISNNNEKSNQRELADGTEIQGCGAHFFEFFQESCEMIDRQNLDIAKEKRVMKNNLPANDKKICITTAEYLKKRVKVTEDRRRLWRQLPFDPKKEFLNVRHCDNTGPVRKMTQNEENYCKSVDAFKVVRKILKSRKLLLNDKGVIEGQKDWEKKGLKDFVYANMGLSPGGFEEDAVPIENLTASTRNDDSESQNYYQCETKIVEQDEPEQSLTVKGSSGKVDGSKSSGGEGDPGNSQVGKN
jgi:hypothetical protein